MVWTLVVATAATTASCYRSHQLDERTPGPDAGADDGGRPDAPISPMGCDIPIGEGDPHYPDAVVSWVSIPIEGVLATAVRIRGPGVTGRTGTIELWSDARPYRGEALSTPADFVYEMSQSEVDQLVRRIQAADTDALHPEVPSRPEQCYQHVVAQECEGCPPTLDLEFDRTDDIRPELDCFIEWMQTRGAHGPIPGVSCDY